MEQIMFWLVLLIVLLAVEMATLGLTTIWFAGGALIAAFAALLNAPALVQILLFFLVSIVLLVFTRPVAVKYFNRGRIRTNAESIVGRQGIVTGEINNLHGQGQVTVGGQEWSARNADDGNVIPVGTVVTVISISGVKLMVREVKTVRQEPARKVQAEE